ncbi:Branched-chain amino acid ABC transporter, amino acid-binding protein [Sandaracinus amylolyticus]|uniref:Branched-chain amino acid ABC transporter, amino acid-binding protein n=2 Tax=Sandaracinus amylolyticus TaxID=927083 RepID=A0A0F6YK77_9BACT|nr:Branched-chain amino acid ABC transporter, amino acid-binding protein [Sandaracinus amylolyticus]
MMLAACEPSAPPAAGVVAGELVGWSPLPQLAAPRGQHAAALLRDGRVLVVGGVNRLGFVTAAEVFDPAAGTWSSAGSPGIQGNVTAGLVLPSGEVFFHADSGDTALYEPATGAWSAGPAIPGRTLATFTLLRSGQVLIAGGSNEASAVLYDPATDAVTPTGSMEIARRAATAALLRDGRVLVVSGFNSSGSEVPSAALYDPAAGTWTAAAPPLVPRHYATATLLPDGRVLLAGGFSSAGVTNHAELYDPVANTWTATGALSRARNGHSATLLPSGEVLALAGADGARNPVALSERYDPATGTWTATTNLAIPSENHTATLLPTGRVLVAGGFSLSPATTFYERADLYDPGDERWVPAGNLAQGRAPATALLPTGRVLLAGGRGVAGVSSTTEIYTRSSNTWAPAAPLAAARERATLTVLRSGEALIVGGSNGAGPLATAERFDHAADVWQPAGAMTSPRDGHTATLLASGSVLIAGGGDATAELYDPATGTWSNGARMATDRTNHASVRLPDGRVLVVGGEQGGVPLASAELYDPVTNAWSPAASLSQARASFTLVLLPSGGVLAAGGTTLATELASAELYDAVANVWSPAGTLTGPRARHAAVTLPSGIVLVAGGQGPGGAVLATAEIFDPATRRWEPVSGLAAQRLRLGLEVLPSGEVLAVGGQGAGGAWLASAELFEPTGAQPAWRPVVTSTTLTRGCPSAIRGTGLRGISQASYGSTMSSPTNYPVVRLTAAEGGRTWPLASRDGSDTGVTIDVPPDVPPGPYVLTVYANAIPGGAMATVVDNTPPAADDGAVTTPYGVPVEITLGATDVEGDELTLTIVTPPEHGTLGTIESGRVTYSPEPGFVGADTFVFRARDCGLDGNEATIEIAVVDATAPSVTCPADVAVVTDGASASATWPAPTASDDVTTSPAIVSSAEPGSTFPLGTTTVTVTASDGAGNTATCTFDVTVRDDTAPAVTCPADVDAEATGSTGAAVTWPPATADGATLTYSAESGSTFPLGTTTVEATATDAAGNTATCTFDVTVRSARAPSSGCGCGVAGTARGGLEVLLVGLVLGALWSRRRR